MDVELYRCKSPKNRLNKVLEKTVTVSATLYEYTQTRNRLSFQFTVSDGGDFNYIYIPDFRRYYFVETVSLAENGMNVYECECDYLMTYKAIISGLSIKCRGSTKKCITNDVTIDRTESNVLITLHRG